MLDWWVLSEVSDDIFDSVHTELLINNMPSLQLLT